MTTDTTLPATTALSPRLTNSFAGPTRLEAENGQPPDSSMAVGPSNVVVVVTDAIAWYDKNGNRQELEKKGEFFDRVNDVDDFFDAKVTYDPFDGHFYAISLFKKQDPNDPTEGESQIFVAKSNTSDPNDGWTTNSFDSLVSFTIPATGTSPAVTNNYWADYPTLSVDAYGVYITANYFKFTKTTKPGDEPELSEPPRAGDGSSTRLFMLDKNDISASHIYDPEKSTGLPSVLTPHAATVYGSQSDFGLTGSFLVGYQQNDRGPDALYVIQVNDAAMGSSGGASFSMTPISVGDISNISPTSIQNFAPQPGSSVGLDAGNGWVYSAVWRGGILYATTEIVIENQGEQRAVVHWFEINTTNMTLIDQGNVTADDLGRGTNTYYGNIIVDAAGQFAIGFSASSPTLFPGAYYAVHSPNDPKGTMEGTQALATGQSSFLEINSLKDDNRWGDYSGAAVDPSDDRSFWFFNQYGTSLDEWATKIGHVDAPPPVLFL